MLLSASSIEAVEGSATAAPVDEVPLVTPGCVCGRKLLKSSFN